MKCIVHIGIEKTGTTSIQRVLADNISILRSYGWHHPQWASGSQHVKLAIFCQNDGRYISSKTPLGYDTPDRIDQLRQKFKREFLDASSRGKNIILSSEWLHSRIALPEEVQRLAEIIYAHNYTPKVIVYLRRQDELLNSRFSTAVKNGQSSWSDWRANQKLEYYDFKRLLNLYSGVFGASYVVPRIYERGQLVNQSIEADFFSQAGLPAKILSESKIENSNASLSRDALKFLMRFNKFKPARVDGHLNPERYGLIDRLLMVSQGSSHFLQKEDAKNFYHGFRETNEWVRENWFPDKGKLFSEDFSIYPEEFDLESFTADDAISISAELFSLQARRIIELKGKSNPE